MDRRPGLDTIGCQIGARGRSTRAGRRAALKLAELVHRWILIDLFGKDPSKACELGLRYSCARLHEMVKRKRLSGALAALGASLLAEQPN